MTDEFTAPLPAGMYQGVVQRIDEPVELKSRPGMFRVPFVLMVNGRVMVDQYSGFMNTAVMLYRNRNVWIGTTFDVKVRIREHEGIKYNTVDIQWEQP